MGSYPTFRSKQPPFLGVNNTFTGSVRPSWQPANHSRLCHTAGRTQGAGNHRGRTVLCGYGLAFGRRASPSCGRHPNCPGHCSRGPPPAERQSPAIDRRSPAARFLPGDVRYLSKTSRSGITMADLDRHQPPCYALAPSSFRATCANCRLCSAPRASNVSAASARLDAAWADQSGSAELPGCARA